MKFIKSETFTNSETFFYKFINVYEFENFLKGIV